MSTTTATGTIEHVDPATLTIATNVRTDVNLGKEFTDSIRTNGVLQPIVATRDTGGVLHVRYGQRRTRAAQEVGLSTVPVFIVDANDEDTASRIIEQLVENEHRDALRDHERVQAWKQLEIEGLSVAQIAKRTGTTRDTIKTGLAVAASVTGTELVAGGTLTLDQAATLIEFEGDPEVLESLTQTAMDEPDYFPVAVERARREAKANATRATVAEAEAAKGHTILEERPYTDPAYVSLHHLRTPDGEPVKPEDVEGKTGVAVYIAVWGEDDAHLSYFLTDHEAHGYTLAAHYTAPTPAPSGPMTDEQKAERKTLIANNKEWDAAETVRREWLTTLLTRKTLPKNAQTVIATSLATAGGVIAQALGHGNTVAASILGITDGHGSTRIADYLTAHPARAAHVTLALVLGGIEESTSRWSWRNPEARTAAYLNTLAAWGYTLTPVERIAAMLPTENTDTDAQPED